MLGMGVQGDGDSAVPSSLLPSPHSVLRLHPNPSREGATATEGMCSPSAPHPQREVVPLTVLCLRGEVGAVFQREGPLHSPCFDLVLGSGVGPLPVPSILLPPLEAREDRLPSLCSSFSPWGGSSRSLGLWPS